MWLAVSALIAAVGLTVAGRYRSVAAGIVGMLAVMELLSAALIALRFPVTVPPDVQHEGRLVDSRWGVVSPDLLPVSPGRVPRGDDDRTRIIFIGDSFTRGSGVAESDGFVSLLSAQLGSQFELLNHAMGGWGFTDQFAQFIDHTVMFEPDVLVWVFNLNDFGDPPFANRTDDLVNDASMRALADARPYTLGLARFAWGRLERTRQSEQWYAGRYSGEKNPDFAPFFKERMQTVVDATDGRVVFAVFPLLHDLDGYPFREAHHNLTTLASQVGAETIDLLSAFEGRDERSLWVSEADHHPNARGHRLAAQALLPALEEPASELPVRSALNCIALGEIRVQPALKTAQARSRVCVQSGDTGAWRHMAEAHLALVGGSTSADQARLTMLFATHADTLDPQGGWFAEIIGALEDR